jgi:hypothetical protein
MGFFIAEISQYVNSTNVAKLSFVLDKIVQYNVDKKVQFGW